MASKVWEIIREIIEKIANIHEIINTMIVGLSISEKRQIADFLTNIVYSLGIGDFLRLNMLLKTFEATIRDLKQKSAQKELYEDIEDLIKDLLKLIRQKQRTPFIPVAVENKNLVSIAGQDEDEEDEFRLYLSNLKQLSDKLNK